MLGLLIAFAVTGLIVGVLARVLMPGPDPMSIPVTILVGIGGSLVGGFLGNLLFRRPGGFILSVISAMLIIYVMRRSRTV
jgi:uncharacterized membrane protein YeaQ/YmgE (transglycosylase-associated protein family)